MKKKADKEKSLNKDINLLVAAENVKNSMAYYRKMSQRSLLAVIIISMMLFFSLSINFMQAKFKSPPTYFAVTQDLRMASLKPLSEPTMSEAGLLSWTGRTIIDTFTLSFTTYKKQLMQVRDNYSEKAFSSILTGLKQSEIIKLLEKRYNSRAVLENAPVITKSGVIREKGKKVAVWKIECPIIISFESSRGSQAPQNLLAKIIVKRVSTKDAPKGVKIIQVILK